MTETLPPLRDFTPLRAQIAALIAERGRFAKLGWAEISRGVGLPLDRLRQAVPDRSALFEPAFAEAQAAALAVAEQDGADWREASARDRLFEMLMSYLDALAAMRPALAVAQSDPDPLWRLQRLRGAFAFAGACLAAAGIVTAGLLGLRAVIALQKTLDRVYCIWLTDNSADLGATLKALDAALSQVSGQFKDAEMRA